MSEGILKALMQLFAIVAQSVGETGSRRELVEGFLSKLLNRDLVKEYLHTFEKFYQSQIDRSGKALSAEKLHASRSVKILKICTQINTELTQKQKIIVVIRLLEFIESEDAISDEFYDFVKTVAELFRIDASEFKEIKDFVLGSDIQSTASGNFMLISSMEPGNGNIRFYRLFVDDCEILVLRLKSISAYFMKFVGAREVYLNSQLIHAGRIYNLSMGSSVKISNAKSLYYSDITSRFQQKDDHEQIRFTSENISYKFGPGQIGVQPFSFSEESGKMVGIMGASGAGKTTLINVLNGSLKPSSGKVVINGHDVHSDIEDVKGLMGYVSQDDLLMEDLTVFQNLYYNAKLCFGDLSKKAIIRRVLKTLKNLGLYEIKDMKVGSPLDKKISGGQRKRLNIALELIREPSILFLDEPTSGLSSRDSENILDLLKELTIKGKLVFVVIHQPSSDIFKMFDRLIFMDNGGYCIYNGFPTDAINYFKAYTNQVNVTDSECGSCGNINPEQIFSIIDARVLDDYGMPTETRKVSPREWYRHYLNQSVEKVKSKGLGRLPGIVFKPASKAKQLSVFFLRDLISKYYNRNYLLINLLETPILALIISMILKYRNPDALENEDYVFSQNPNLVIFMFVSVIIAFFVGLTMSAEEIIKDRKILKRETYLNLSKSSYHWSKIGIMFGIAAIQSLLFVVISNRIFGVESMYLEYWLVLFSVWSVAILLGLNISDSFKKVINIYIFIPFLIIPQLILSGVLVRFDKFNPDLSSPVSIPWYGEIMTARWGFESLAVKQFRDNEYEKDFYAFHKVMSQSNYKKDYWLNALKDRLEYCSMNYSDEEKKEEVSKRLLLLKNEIEKENKSLHDIEFIYTEKISPELFNASVYNQLKDYFGKLNKHYIKRYNTANELYDEKVKEVMEELGGSEDFHKYKQKYYNEELDHFITNTKNIFEDKLVEYDNELHQKVDPIYLESTSEFLKAHLYAPRKNLGAFSIDTYWMNLLAIWITTLLLYLALELRIFNGIGAMASRFNRK